MSLIEVSFSLNFRRFSYWRLLLIPGSVKLCESTGRAGGLLMINYAHRKNMPKKYMVFWKPENKPNDEYISLIPEEIKTTQALKEKGKIVEDWIALDRSKGWILMQGESENEVVDDLKALPLYRFLTLEITELFVPG